MPLGLAFLLFEFSKPNVWNIVSAASIGIFLVMAVFVFPKQARETVAIWRLRAHYRKSLKELQRRHDEETDKLWEAVQSVKRSLSGGAE